VQTCALPIFFIRDIARLDNAKKITGQWRSSAADHHSLPVGAGSLHAPYDPQLRRFLELREFRLAGGVKDHSQVAVLVLFSFPSCDEFENAPFSGSVSCRARLVAEAIGAALISRVNCVWLIEVFLPRREAGCDDSGSIGKKLLPNNAVSQVVLTDTLAKTRADGGPKRKVTQYTGLNKASRLVGAGVGRIVAGHTKAHKATDA